MMLENRRECLESIDKAGKWLRSIQNEDGSMNPVSNGALSYYKVPCALLIGGEHQAANRLLDWAKMELMTEEGDFQAERKNWHASHYVYSSSWFVWVAQRLSRFDVSYKGMEYLLRFVNPKTGGFCSKGLYVEDQENEQDLLSTSFTAFVGLHLNRITEAIAAGGWIESLLGQQPHPETELWIRMDDDGRLITSVPERGEPNYYVLVAKEPKQHYYFVGGAIVFLAKLYSITKDEKYLKMANRFVDFALSCHEDAFLTDGTGKVGLGAAYLYYLTKDEKYLRAAERSAVFLLDDQQPEGYWVRGGKPTASSTGEFVVWLTEIVSCCS